MSRSVKVKLNKRGITQKATQPEKNLPSQNINWRHCCFSCTIYSLKEYVPLKIQYTVSQIPYRVSQIKYTVTQIQYSLTDTIYSLTDTTYSVHVTGHWYNIWLNLLQHYSLTDTAYSYTDTVYSLTYTVSQIQCTVSRVQYIVSMWHHWYNIWLNLLPYCSLQEEGTFHTCLMWGGRMSGNSCKAKVIWLFNVHINCSGSYWDNIVLDQLYWPKYSFSLGKSEQVQQNLISVNTLTRQCS